MTHRILNYGSINIDEFFHVPHICKSGETLSSTEYALRAGGKGANQSMALAQAGANVYHAGNIGYDAIWIKDHMEQNGVDMTFTHIKEKENNGRAFIQVSGETGDNCIVLYPGTNHTNAMEEVKEVLSSFEKGDWIIQQNEINNGGNIMRLAVEKGLSVLFNPAPVSEDVIKQFPFQDINILIVNEHEAQALYEQLSQQQYSNVVDLPEKLMDILPSLEGIIITLGKEGLSAKFKNNKEIRNYRIAGREVIVKDTTGAGDTFVGYFLASFVRRHSEEYFRRVEMSLIEANYASSIAVQRVGSMASIPSSDEVRKCMTKEEAYHY